MGVELPELYCYPLTHKPVEGRILEIREIGGVMLALYEQPNWHPNWRIWMPEHPIPQRDARVDNEEPLGRKPSVIEESSLGDIKPSIRAEVECFHSGHSRYGSYRRITVTWYDNTTYNYACPTKHTDNPLFHALLADFKRGHVIATQILRSYEY